MMATLGKPQRQHRILRILEDQPISSQAQLVQLVGDIIASRQIQRQPVERRLRELEGGGRPQSNPDAAFDALRDGQRVEREVRGKREVIGRDDLDGPERYVVRSPKLARGDIVSGELALHGAAAGDGEARRQRWFVEVGRELRDQHRRRRREVVRIDRLEQGLREPGKFSIQFEVDPRGQESHAFDQAFDIRVGDFDAGHAQPGGNLRELLGELCAHLVEVLQLEIVVLQESRVHLHDPRGRDVRHLDFAGFEVDLGTNQEVDGDRLRP